jgi:hypothetical protein
MRTTRFLLATALLAGCNWTEFDDLADTTWVRSTDEPNIGSRNFGIAILGVSTSGQGGQLAVISDDTPDFSTIDYAADGTDTVGQSLKLGQHRIAALTDPPLFATDGQGKIALAERSTTGGNTSVVYGPATGPAGVELATVASPDAVTFADADVVVAAGNTLYTIQGSTQLECPSADMGFGAAAIASDGAYVFMWAKTGAFFAIPRNELTQCPGGKFSGTGNLTTSLVPAAGARIHVVGNFAVLTAHAPNSRMGQVITVNTSNPNNMTITDMLDVEGLRSSTILIGNDSGRIYVAVGVPDRAVGNVIAGQVDVYEVMPPEGMLQRTPALQLNDAKPESGQLFGRSVTAMTFNGTFILVVAAYNEVFAYYKTALYDALP